MCLYSSCDQYFTDRVHLEDCSSGGQCSGVQGQGDSCGGSFQHQVKPKTKVTSHLLTPTPLKAIEGKQIKCVKGKLQIRQDYSFQKDSKPQVEVYLFLFLVSVTNYSSV